MDYDFLRQAVPLFASAALLTLRLSLAGILLSVLAGLLCAAVRYMRIPVLRQIASIYIEFSRNTPLLIQVFFLYFAFPRMGIKLSSVQCAVIGLTFLGGSYMAETFRSAIEGVSKIQIESAESLGLKNWQIMLYVVLPQAVSVSVSGFCANVMFMIKETSVFSAIALAELMYVAKDLIGLYYKTSESLLLLSISYLVILLPVSVAANFAERRLRYAEFGNA